MNHVVAQLHFQPCEPLPAHLTSSDSRASRYLVLERVTPCLRHHLVGQLHPISLITSVLAQQVANDPAGVPGMPQKLKDICDLLGAATTSVGDATKWLRPDQEELVALSACVHECVELLNGSFNFRGYALFNAIGDIDMPVHRDAVRICLVTALLAATDAAISDTARIVIRAAVTLPHALVLTIAVEASDQEKVAVGHDDGGDVVSWLDCEIIASTHGVAASTFHNDVSLSFAAGGLPGHPVQQQRPALG
ncbi:MAG: hypothetical protein EOO54_25840 [Haliea sp.]|nr:MAG: hypothetical protein EOO54_25840 [Haliea sp.]